MIPMFSTGSMLAGAVTATRYYELPGISLCMRVPPENTLPNGCSIELNDHGYLVDVSTGRTVFQRATQQTVMDYYSLYRSGNNFIVEYNNFSSSKTWTIAVFTYNGGHVRATDYMTISRHSQPDGVYWVGQACRGAAELNKESSPLVSAFETLCGNNEEPDWMAVKVTPATKAAEKAGLVVSLPTYDNRTRSRSQSTYVFVSSASPSASTMLCLDGCPVSTDHEHLGGWIGTSLWIDMNLEFTRKRAFSGSYFYTREETPIRVSGSIEGDAFNASEFKPLINKPSASFIGEKYGNSYMGKWSSFNKAYDFFLALRLY